MLSPDRAEFESKLSQVPESAKKSRHLPRWLLNPVFATRLTLATLTGLGAAAGADFIGSVNPNVSAATQCTGDITILGFRYFDRYPVDGKGRENIIDKDDLALEPLPEQVVHLYDKGKSPIKTAILRQPNPNSFDRATFRITPDDKVNCDYTATDGSEGATFYFDFDTDRGNLHWVGMRNKSNTWLYEGIKEDNPVRLTEYLIRNPDTRQVGTSSQQIIETPNFFVSAQKMKDDDPVANRAIIREFIAQSQKKDMGWEKLVMDGRRFATDWWGVTIALGIPLAYWYTIFTAKALWDKSIDRFYRFSYKDKVSELKSQLENAVEANASLKTDMAWYKQEFSREAFKNQGLRDEIFSLRIDNRSLSYELEQLKLRPKTAPRKTSPKSAQSKSGTVAKASQPGGSLVAEVERLKEELARKKSEIERIRSKYSPDWVTGQKAAATKWQKAKEELSPVRPGNSGKEPEYVLARFKAGMDIIHEVALGNSAIEAPQMGVQVRAAIEYLIPEIWPDMRILIRFFDHNFYTGFWTPEDLAKIIYMPRQSRTQANGSLTDDQVKAIKRLNNVFRHALANDKALTYKVEADPELENHISLIYNRFGIAWGNHIEGLIKYR